MKNIRLNRPRLPQGVTLSPSCMELLGMLLVPWPGERASLEAVLSCVFLNPTPEQVQRAPEVPTFVATKFDSETERLATYSAALPLPPPGAAVAADKAAGREADALSLYSPNVASVHPLRTREGGDGGGFLPSPVHRPPQPSELGLSQTSARSDTSAERQRQKAQGAPPLVEKEQVARRLPATASSRPPGAQRSGHDEMEKGAKSTQVSSHAAASPSESASGRSRSDAARDNITNAGEPSVAEGAGRNNEGQWAWDWGVRMAPTGGGGQGGKEEILSRIQKGGPLPSLPTLPFALESQGGGRRSFSGTEGPEAAPELAFDLAFAACPGDEECRSAAVDAVADPRERRSLSVNDAPSPPRAAARAEALGPDLSRRKRNDEDTFGRTMPTTRTHNTSRRKSFSGDSSAPVYSDGHFSPHPCQPSGRGGTGGGRGGGSGSSGSSGSGTRGRSPDRPSPVPVFYYGRGGSLPTTNTSPARKGERMQSPGIPTPESPIVSCLQGEAVGHTSASTPQSPVYYRSVKGDGSSQSSPARGCQNVPPVLVGHQPGSLQFERGKSPQVLIGDTPGAGGGGGAGDARGMDGGGMPIIVKYPSCRPGCDSLLTIPEDSTGFLLIPRLPLIPCEHGPNCECGAWFTIAEGNFDPDVVISPSKPVIPTVNPYGGPGKAPAKVPDRRQSTRGAGPSSFLGLGTIWNTAVNTFRGVAGAHSRRASSSRRTNHAHAAQQGVSLTHAPPPPSPGAVSGGLSSAPGTAAVVPSASREHLSPHGTHRRTVDCARSPGGGADISSEQATLSPSAVNDSAFLTRSPADPCRSHGSGVSSPTIKARSPQGVRREDTPAQLEQQRQQFHRRRHHSDSSSRLLLDGRATRQSPQQSALERQPTMASYTRRQSYDHVAGDAREGGAGEMRSQHTLSQLEVVDWRRVKAAAERAEVVGKRSILVVTLADRTVREAMSLALESPRDARSSTCVAETGSPSHGSCARRRHDMLTEALSLYVKALAMLQGTLPAVLVECDGVAMDGFAAWNPLGLQSQDPQHHQYQHKQQQQQHQPHRFGFAAATPPLPPSQILLEQRASLVTKASWLIELFSKTLERAQWAQHCRTQAPTAASAATVSVTLNPGTPKEKSCGGAGAASPVAPWAKLGGGGTDPGNSSGYVATPSSDTAAAAAVYRSAVEHGQEAAVCYLLGRSDAAITHNVRACALLRLLALEPEMAGTADRLREDVRMNEQQQQQQQQNGPLGDGGGGGWKAQLLSMAEGYARSAELISTGAAGAGGEGEEILHQQDENGALTPGSNGACNTAVPAFVCPM